MSAKPCAGTYEFRIGVDADGAPCLDMFEGGILPVGYITREQLMAVLEPKDGEKARS